MEEDEKEEVVGGGRGGEAGERQINTFSEAKIRCSLMARDSGVHLYL